MNLIKSVKLKVVIFEFKSQVAFVLVLIWLFAVWNFRSLNSVLFPLFAVGLMIVLDVTYTRLRFRKWYFPSASIVTGLLIGLIIDTQQPVWVIAAAVLLAFFSKQFIGRGLRQNIFNPAAFGIMAVSLIFNIGIAWWAVAWGKLPLLILIPSMVWILFKMKRLWLSFTFIGVYFVYFLFTFRDLESIILSLLDGSFLLFALVMLPEPITSPTFGKWKYIFGTLAAVVSLGLTKFVLPEVFLPSLLIVDLGAFLLRNFLGRFRGKFEA